MSFLPSVGKIRRSQGVTTFGIGAIVDFATGSFMPLGLYHMDRQWQNLSGEAKAGIKLYEPRLQKLLGVNHFRSLPTPGEGQIGDYGDRVESSWAVPCVRFPKWLECPKCHRLGKTDDPFILDPDMKVKCPKCGTNVNPVRFVITCRKAHIDDFPWVEWVHRDSGEACPNPVIYLNSKGKSAALGDLYLKCGGCGAGQGLGRIFTPAEMKKFRCHGRQPWLISSEKCGDDIITLQRGGSNVHFPLIASMLSIPPASESIAKILEPEWQWLSAVPDKALVATIEGFFRNSGISLDPEAAVTWVRRRKGIETDDSSNELSARFQEYESLISDCRPLAIETHLPEFENHPFSPEEGISDWVDLISAVHRLREVRALCGFTRIQPFSLNIEDIPDALIQKKIAPLSAGQMNWRPAIEVRGEGIFMRFNEQRVTEWASNPVVIERAEAINRIFTGRCEDNGIEPPYRITPRHLLVHSLAHILIRRMSLDCGYSSASLRERLYISDGEGEIPPMAGILIYTASPDSDGSLGGIVNLATPERMTGMLKRAIQDASWCGNDPVCIETEPRIHGDRLSAAACHNCLLLPETACEKFNRELDRGMLTGFPDPATGNILEGFFSNFSLD